MSDLAWAFCICVVCILHFYFEIRDSIEREKMRTDANRRAKESLEKWMEEYREK